MDSARRLGVVCSRVERNNLASRKQRRWVRHSQPHVEEPRDKLRAKGQASSQEPRAKDARMQGSYEVNAMDRSECASECLRSMGHGMSAVRHCCGWSGMIL